MVNRTLHVAARGTREAVEEQGEAKETLWTAEQLREYLNVKGRETIGNMVRSGRITCADGLMRLGYKMVRFDAKRVKQRLRAGLFGRGLDENGKPTLGA